MAELKTWGPPGRVPDVEVCGWVRSVRKSSGVRFIDITDGSSMRPAQVVVDKSLATEYVIRLSSQSGLMYQIVADTSLACAPELLSA